MRGIFYMKKMVQDSHNPFGYYCGRWIIHVFLIFFAQTVPSTVFGPAMIPFSLFSLPILFLCFAMVHPLAGNTAWMAAINLSPEARSANMEYEPAPSAGNFDQKQNGRPSGLANNRKMA